MCLFDSNDSVLLFSENKYDDDDDDLPVLITPTVWPHMQDGGQQEVKTLLFGIVDGTNKRGRPRREWMDDIVSWCKTGLQELNSLVQDRRRWKLIIHDKQWTPTGTGLTVPEEERRITQRSSSASHPDHRCVSLAGVRRARRSTGNGQNLVGRPAEFTAVRESLPPLPADAPATAIMEFARHYTTASPTDRASRENLINLSRTTTPGSTDNNCIPAATTIQSAEERVCEAGPLQMHS